jgi:signal transduction histidine kinase
VANAVQHGEGGPISVRVRDDGDEVVVAVHNRGAPVPPELLPSLFDPFRRGQRRAEGQVKSVGLGLYIVQQIVRAHGGQVAIESPDGDGTTVTMRLPRRPGLSRAPAEATLQERPAT